MHLIRTTFFLLTLLLTAGSAVTASPRVLPQQQARHFCRLLFYDDGRLLPLSVYAQHLTAMLCHDFRYGDFTPEQVFTGLIFFYDDWQQEPMPFSNGQGRMLMEELHSGQTLRLFPHCEGATVAWYAPTDDVPASISPEHRKYMQEVFPRLNAEVQAGNWQAVDAFIDKMIRYQCQFSHAQKEDGRWWSSSPPMPSVLVLVVLACLSSALWSVSRLRKVRIVK
jgi:hypothetical protein